MWCVCSVCSSLRICFAQIQFVTGLDFFFLKVCFIDLHKGNALKNSRPGLKPPVLFVKVTIHVVVIFCLLWQHFRFSAGNIFCEFVVSTGRRGAPSLLCTRPKTCARFGDSASHMRRIHMAMANHSREFQHRRFTWVEAGHGNSSVFLTESAHFLAPMLTSTTRETTASEGYYLPFRRTKEKWSSAAHIDIRPG